MILKRFQKWLWDLLIKLSQIIKNIVLRQVKKIQNYSVIINGAELTIIFFIVILMLSMPLLGFISVREEIKILKTEVQILQEDQLVMKEDQRKLAEGQRRLTDAMMAWLEAWQIGTFKASAYSPLDDRNGLNSDGNPYRMATMAKTEDNLDIAIAVDPKTIPLYSIVYIHGVGWRKALDTGGSIKGSKVDICMSSYEEAIEFGVKDVIAIWPKQQPSPEL